MVLAVDRYFEPGEAPAALRAWRDLLPDAPRETTLTADVSTAAPGDARCGSARSCPIVGVGFIWVSDIDAGRYLEFPRHRAGRRRDGPSRCATSSSRASPMPSSIATAGGATWKRSLPRRGVGWGDRRPHRPRRGGGCGARLVTGVPNSGFQAYGGAIGQVADDESAFSHRHTLVEWGRCHELAGPRGGRRADRRGSRVWGGDGTVRHGRVP